MINIREFDTLTKFFLPSYYIITFIYALYLQFSALFRPPPGIQFLRKLYAEIFPPGFSLYWSKLSSVLCLTKYYISKHLINAHMDTRGFQNSHNSLCNGLVKVKLLSDSGPCWRALHNWYRLVSCTFMWICHSTTSQSSDQGLFGLPQLSS